MIQARVEALGLRFRPGIDCELINPRGRPRYRDYRETYHRLMERKGISPDAARTVVRTSCTVIAALMVRGRRATR